MPRRRHVPQYTHHKPSGQARVRIAGKSYYLGRYGTAESKQRYDELIAAYLAGALPPPKPDAPPPATALLVSEVCALFLEHARAVYRKRGAPTSQVRRVEDALLPVADLYGGTAAVAFGPRALKAVRNAFVAQGRVRSSVNALVGVVKQAFAWAASEELLPGAVPAALRTVKGLAKGSGVAPEPARVRPVAWEVVERTLPKLAPQLADAVRLQYLGGMRPCEVLALRPCDVDRTGQVPDGPCLAGLWVYIVAAEWNKTAHRGHARHVLLGPQAQAVLAPYLASRRPDEYVFSPARSVAEHHRRRSAGRKTPRWPSHLRHNLRRRKVRPKLRPGEKYSTHAYSLAVKRAAQAAGVPHWAPNALRHARGTDLRRLAGLDRAGTVLGHCSLQATEIYAERDLQAAAEIIRRVG